MSVMVKRFFIFGMLFGIFFASCSYNSGSNLTTSCSIEVDKDFVSGMRSVLQKSYSDTTQVRVNIECTGGYETSKWYDATIGTLPGVVFSFEEVPFDKTFSIYVGVYKGSELIYEASQKDIVITRTNPSFELSVLLKKLLNTDYVLYNKGEGYIQFYKTEKPVVSVAGNGDFASDTKDYCFDEDGYFYYINTRVNDSGASGADFARPVICSDNPDFPADGIDLSSVLFSEGEQSVEAYVFSIDRATKTFYIYPLTFDDEPKIYKFPKLITSREITDSVCFGLNCSGVYPSQTLSKMVVNNGIMFVTAYRVNDLMPVLLKIDVSSVQNEGTADAEVVANLSSVLNKMNNDNVVINDMLYQDGSVYILVSDMVDHPQSTMTTKLYSRGLLLKYDTSSGNVSSLGFSEEVKKNTDMGTSGLYAYNTDSIQLFVDNSYTKPFVLPSIIAYTDSAGIEQKLDISQYFPSIYSPAPLATSLSNSCFYGAEKFIAIKPKKLVIADDGFAFYTASDGGIKFKNVNRVITVDLEKFAISSINNAKTAFASEVESFSMGTIPSGSTEYQYQTEMKSLTDNNDGFVYYNSDNGPQSLNVTGNDISLAIPCGD